MPQSDNLLFMQNPELATALRRRQMGERLLQQGTDSSPVQHWAQGAARLAQALLGGYQARDADNEIKAAGEKRQALLAKLLSDDGMPAMGGQPAAAPQMPMTAPPPGPVSQAPLAAPNLAPIPPHLSDDDLLVRTVYGEARGETPTGQQAVASVARNRARMANMPLRDVLLAPNQFEPWNNPQTREQLLALDPNSPQYQAIAQAVLGTTNDPTNGATHFYSPRAQAALGRPTPSWAQGQGTDIGNHRFYNLPYSAPRTAPAGDVIPAAAGAPGAPTAPPAMPTAAPAQPAQSGQQDFLGMAQRAQQRAMAAAAAGETALAQQFQNQAVTYRQMALQRQQTELSVVPDPSSASGYRYLPRSQAAGMPAPEPRPMVSIQNTGESAYERQRAETLGGRVKEWEDANVKSAQTLNRLTQMERALDQFTTGAGAGAILKAGQIAQRLNVPAATLDALGINPEQVASGETIRSLASQMLVGMIGSGGFPAQGFSNADREMLERALPGLANSQQGNKMIIQIMRAGAQRDIEIGRAWRDWSRRNGDSLQSVRGFQADVLPGIVERNIVAPILEQGGWMETPTGGGGADDSMPTISDPAEAARLPAGTQFRTPDGTVRRVPAR